MKGLLIKDFHLLKNQKTFFFVILFIAIGLFVSSNDTSFVIGYMSFVGTLFTLSTISYDEFDNGNAFLFTLPIMRKGYVVEKYSFGLILSIISWLLSLILSLISGSIRQTMSIEDTLMIALAIFPILVLILAIMLPFQLKFGAEKSRIAIIGAVGLMFAVGFFVIKIAGLFNVDLITIFNNLPTMSMEILIVAALVIDLIILFLSFKISVGIMNKKEF